MDDPRIEAAARAIPKTIERFEEEGYGEDAYTMALAFVCGAFGLPPADAPAVDNAFNTFLNTTQEATHAQK